MMSLVIHEALFAGIKEGFRTGILLFALCAYFSSRGSNGLLRSFFLAVAGSLALAIAMFVLPQSILSLEVVKNVAMTTVIVFMISAAAVLTDSSGTDLFGSLKVIAAGRSFQAVLVFFGTVLYFFPDYTHVLLTVRDAGVIHEQLSFSFLWAGAGFGIVVSGFYAAVRLNRGRSSGGFFDLPQILICGALLKILTGGGAAETSLITPIQRGLMKFSHDFIHQIFVILMVPDHPLLKTTLWNFIGLLFGPNIASVLSLSILLSCPLLFFYRSLTAPLPEVHARTASQRRRALYSVIVDRRKKMMPVAVFVCAVSVLWFIQKGEDISRLYIPKAKPVVADKGEILIPLNDPTMNLKNGGLHKFSYNHNGEEIKIIAITRSDSSLALCLDACEICPPDGYGQKENQVLCIYCNTPIPVDTLGEPGGCNPVPLRTTVDSTFIRITVDELLNKWQYVKSGKSKGSVK